MRKLAYLECPTGLAGDMCLGALLDVGVPLDYLTTMLARLGLADEYDLVVDRVMHNGFAATKCQVRLTATIAQQQEELALVSEGEQWPTLPHGEHHRHPGHHHHHDHHDHDHHDHDHHAHSDLAEQAVGVPEHGPSRCLPDIEALILAAQLPDRVTQWSLAIFRELAIAEAAVHGAPSPTTAHFHEVGATDAIVDIVGTCLGLDWLGVEALYCSPLPTGGGLVRAAHGWLPVPTPAVLKLWERHQVPVYSNGIQRELVTPTGAAIAVTLATAFGGPPAMQLRAVGLGAGTRSLPIPNMVRLWVGTERDHHVAGSFPLPTTERSRSSPLAAPQSPEVSGSEPTLGPEVPEMQATPAMVVVLTTQVDDLNPQAIGYLYERLFQAGAVDVFTQSVMMKKSRPGILITVICAPDQQATCETVLFAETTTLGIRQQQQQRTVLARSFTTVTTPYGAVQIKLGHHPVTGQLLNAQPEFEDCAQLARQQGVPFRTIHQAALTQWQQQADAPNPVTS